MVSAKVMKRARDQLTQDSVARFQRLRWRSKVAGDDLAPWLARQARDDPRWARGVRYRHQIILMRIRVDAAVGEALGQALGRLTDAEQAMGTMAFAQSCVERSQARHQMERGQRQGTDRMMAQRERWAALTRAKARRAAGVVARFQRFRWSDQVLGQNWGLLFRQQAARDPRWARKVRRWNRWLIEQREFVNSLVAEAQATAWHRQQARQAPRASAVRVILGRP